MTMCSMSTARGFAKGAGAVNILATLYLLNVSQLATMDCGAQRLFAHFNDMQHKTLGFGILSVLSTAILFLIPSERGLLTNKYFIGSALLSLGFGVYLYNVGRYPYPQCQADKGGALYDTLLKNAGTANRNFCTPMCPCNLPEDPFPYMCHDYPHTVADRQLTNHNPQRATSSLQDCRSYPESHNYDLYIYYCMEQRYECSGWCITCNMEILYDSTIDISFNYDQGRNCQFAVQPEVNKLIDKFYSPILAIIGLFGSIFTLEAVKDFIIPDYEKQKSH